MTKMYTYVVDKQSVNWTTDSKQKTLEFVVTLKKPIEMYTHVHPSYE